MICFEVRVNDEHVCTAGFDGHCVMTADATFLNSIDGRRVLEFNVGGMVSANYDSLTWFSRELHIGDRVELAIVENSTPTPPISIKPGYCKAHSGAQSLKEFQTKRKDLLARLAQLDIDEAEFRAKMD